MKLQISLARVSITSHIHCRVANGGEDHAATRGMRRDVKAHTGVRGSIDLQQFENSDKGLQTL
jgi:hypothetical protein